MNEANARRSVRSAVFDWALVIVVSAVSLACIQFPPDSHYFSLLDLSISHAHREQVKVPLWLFVLLTVISPILIITAISFRQSRSHQINNGLLGLGISLGSATVVLNIKNLAGKPRPDFLAVCQPDVTQIEKHTVGGFGQSVSPLWVMVERGICQQPDQALLNDAFRSFPSGYATVAFAGLWYLSLWLCEQFDVCPFVSKSRAESFEIGESSEPLLSERETRRPALRQLPLHFLFLPYLPLGVAIFIAGTRFFDFRNHGIDVVAGAAAGTALGYVGWKWRSP